MKTDRLAKYYRSLAPKERLSLIIGVCDREDFEERDRLVESDPRQVVSVPNHHFLAMALDDLAQRYVSRQLPLLVQYWRSTRNSFKTGKRTSTRKRTARKRAAGSPALGFRISRDDFLRLAKDLKLGEQTAGWSDVTKMAAYLFCVNTDAWCQLCGELSVGDQAILNGVPGADEVARMDSLMRYVAFDAEQANVYVKQVSDGTDEAVSVEEMTAAMRGKLGEKSV